MSTAAILSALLGHADPQTAALGEALRLRESVRRALEDLRDATLQALPEDELKRRAQVTEMFAQHQQGHELGLVAALRGEDE